MTARTALFLSPHLDDVAFSCGGLVARLADEGWRTVIATAFTATVLPATGFALACQTDKGLAADVDYMALRREEDARAAGILGAEARWLDLPEAPHRGYESAAALFGELREDDAAHAAVAGHVEALVRELDPELVLAPQGLGRHVDHRQVVRAVLASVPADRLGFFRDTPYVIRDPRAEPDALLVVALDELEVPVLGALERKIGASCAYASQVGFQFGGPEAAATALTALAEREGGGFACERFRTGASALRRMARAA